MRHAVDKHAPHAGSCARAHAPSSPIAPARAHRPSHGASMRAWCACRADRASGDTRHRAPWERGHLPFGRRLTSPVQSPDVQSSGHLTWSHTGAPHALRAPPPRPQRSLTASVKAPTNGRQEWRRASFPHPTFYRPTASTQLDAHAQWSDGGKRSRRCACLLDLRHFPRCQRASSPQTTLCLWRPHR